ncbi:MAG: methyltransferase domain-containing protein [Deltaproteobacteria bacterium]|nr:methyltransferase domain-containing protein [Deltaproteobacteria bacterium]
MPHNAATGTGILGSAHYVNPDIETASQGYAARFAGPVGEYFLQQQRTLVDELMSHAGERPLQVLDVGGGHAQLTPLLLERGCEVFVHGSSINCAERLKGLGGAAEQLHFFVSPLDAIRPPIPQFDVVLAFRLLPHVLDWQRFLTQIAQFTRSQLIFDFTSIASLNAFSPIFFKLKKQIEKNTRPYFVHSLRQIEDHVAELGFEEIAVRKQFSFPMGAHRALNDVRRSKAIESVSKKLYLTSLIGSPVIVSAKR